VKKLILALLLLGLFYNCDINGPNPAQETNNLNVCNPLFAISIQDTLIPTYEGRTSDQYLQFNMRILSLIDTIISVTANIYLYHPSRGYMDSVELIQRTFLQTSWTPFDCDTLELWSRPYRTEEIQDI